MLLSEVLRKTRTLFLSERYRIAPELVDFPGMLLEATSGDAELACDALEALDKQSPGSNFGFWADGGTWVENADGEWEPVYRYDTKPAAVAAVMGLASMRALNAEG